MSKEKNKKWEVKYTPKFLESFEKLFSNNIRYLIPRKLSDWKHEIKWAWQRVFKGYDDQTIWSMHSSISDYFPKMIRELKNEVHGYPSDPFNKEKQEIKSIKDWKNVLEKIAIGFDAARKIDGHEYIKEVKLKKPRKDMFGKDSYIGHKIDKKHYDKLYKEFEEGIELFKKYYFSLWD